MIEATSDQEMPERPEPTIEEIRASNRGGIWVLLALAVIWLVALYVRGINGIFDGPWR